MSLLANTNQPTIKFKTGRTWTSFENFRQEGAKALESVKDGTVAVLQTKTGQYRILEEKDFQKLYGLAREIERLQGGLRIIGSAIRAVQKHPDDETLKVLIESVNFLGSVPELPTRDSFEPLEPEGFELDEDDEVILDPEELQRSIYVVND